MKHEQTANKKRKKGESDGYGGSVQWVVLQIAQYMGPLRIFQG